MYEIIWKPLLSIRPLDYVQLTGRTPANDQQVSQPSHYMSIEPTLVAPIQPPPKNCMGRYTL